MMVMVMVRMVVMVMVRMVMVVEMLIFANNKVNVDCDEHRKKFELIRRNFPTERKTSSAFQADTSVGA